MVAGTRSVSHISSGTGTFTPGSWGLARRVALCRGLISPFEPSSSACCQGSPVQLADVVGDGHQGPFTVDLLQPP